MYGDNGASSVWELLRDEHSGSPVLEQEQHQSVPNDALKDHNLDHQAPRELAVHPFEQRDAHNQGVRKGGDGEQSY